MLDLSTCFLSVNSLGMQLADGLDFGRAIEDIKEVVDWTTSNGCQKVASPLPLSREAATFPMAQDKPAL